MSISKVRTVEERPPILAIIPRKGSRKFKKQITEEFFQKDQSGQEVKTHSDTYDLERWDGTMEERTPQFDNQTERFRIVNPEDPERKELLINNSPLLNEMAHACRLRYEDGEDKGKIIEKVDIFDRVDPFLTHSELYHTLEAGSAFLDLSIPMHKFMQYALLAYDDFSLGGSKYNEALPASVRYLVIDNNIDREIRKKMRINTAKVVHIFEELSDDDMLKFALALNVINDASYSDIAVIEELLYEYSNNTNPLPDGSMTHQEHFIQTYESGKNILDASWIFTKAMATGVIRFKDGVFQAFGKMLGNTRDEAISQLTVPARSELLDMIRQAVERLEGVQTPLTRKTSAEIPIDEGEKKDKTKPSGRESATINVDEE